MFVSDPVHPGTFREATEPEAVAWLTARGYGIRKAKTPQHAAGSATSAAAAASLLPVLGRLQKVVLEAIQLEGGRGLTDDELEVQLHMSHQSASARRRELQLRGDVIDSNRTRRTRSGRNAVVWVAAPPPPPPALP
jgi:hypothetical protein